MTASPSLPQQTTPDFPQPASMGPPAADANTSPSGGDVTLTAEGDVHTSNSGLRSVRCRQATVPSSRNPHVWYEPLLIDLKRSPTGGNPKAHLMPGQRQ